MLGRDSQSVSRVAKREARRPARTAESCGTWVDMVQLGFTVCKGCILAS